MSDTQAYLKRKERRRWDAIWNRWRIEDLRFATARRRGLSIDDAAREAGGNHLEALEQRLKP